jgi:hypothetical protein
MKISIIRLLKVRNPYHKSIPEAVFDLKKRYKFEMLLLQDAGEGLIWGKF